MSRRSFMTFAAGISVVSGLVGLIAPGQLGALFGLAFDDVAVAQGRLLGASYLGYAAITWLARDVTERTAVQAIALGSAVSWGLSAIVTMAGIVTGFAGSQAVLLVAVEAAFAATWTSFALGERTTVAPA